MWLSIDEVDHSALPLSCYPPDQAATLSQSPEEVTTQAATLSQSLEEVTTQVVVVGTGGTRRLTATREEGSGPDQPEVAPPEMTTLQGDRTLHTGILINVIIVITSRVKLATVQGDRTLHTGILISVIMVITSRVKLLCIAQTCDQKVSLLSLNRMFTYISECTYQVTSCCPETVEVQ